MSGGWRSVQRGYKQNELRECFESQNSHLGWCTSGQSGPANVFVIARQCLPQHGSRVTHHLSTGVAPRWLLLLHGKFLQSLLPSHASQLQLVGNRVGSEYELFKLNLKVTI